MLLRNTNKFIGYLINHFRYYLFSRAPGKQPRSRLEEIDILKNIIVIHCRGIDAPIKLSFDEIINDTAILSSFTSKHASWIGYYYGKYYNGLINDKLICNASFNLFEDSNTRCSIHLITREGNLIYIDSDTNKSHIISPIKIMTHKDLIEKFAPIEACFIGILSSLYEKRNFKHNSFSISSNNPLRLVK